MAKMILGHDESEIIFEVENMGWTKENNDTELCRLVVEGSPQDVTLGYAVLAYRDDEPYIEEYYRADNASRAEDHFQMISARTWL